MQLREEFHLEDGSILKMWHVVTRWGILKARTPRLVHHYDLMISVSDRDENVPGHAGARRFNYENWVVTVAQASIGISELVALVAEVRRSVRGMLGLTSHDD